MGATIIEKILARASGKERVRPGEIAVCRPDLVIQLDQILGIDGWWYPPKKVFDPERIAVVFDHCVPAPTIQDAAGMTEGRRFAKEFGIKALVDVGHHGISHVIAAERGLARPGELLVCVDSHTCAAGALNCAGRGIGPVDTLQALAKGVVWFPVSPTIRYEFQGSMGRLVSGKDVFFHIAQTYGAHGNTTVEFGGAGLSALKMSDRRTIATMCAELSAEFALFEYDEITEQYLQGRLSRPASAVHPDADADYLDLRIIDLAKVEPYVIRPDYVQKNGERLSTFKESIAIDQAFIGSCANGQIEDLRMAAEIVRGRQVAPGVRLIVTPGSQAIHLQAAKEGVVTTLLGPAHW